MNDYEQRRQQADIMANFLARHKGAGVSIVLLLAILPREFTTGEKWLATMIPYSARAIRDALAKLETDGLARRIKRVDGWQLTAAIVQLPLPFTSLPTENFSARPSSSSSLILDPISAKAEKEEKEPQRKTFPLAELSEEAAELRRLLIKGGIGPNSAKMGEILQSGLTLAAGRACVLYALARRQGRVSGADRYYPAGYLITELANVAVGAPAPADRCEDCLAELDAAGRCFVCELVEK